MLALIITMVGLNRRLTYMFLTFAIFSLVVSGIRSYDANGALSRDNYVALGSMDTAVSLLTTCLRNAEESLSDQRRGMLHSLQKRARRRRMLQYCTAQAAGSARTVQEAYSLLQNLNRKEPFFKVFLRRKQETLAVSTLRPALSEVKADKERILQSLTDPLIPRSVWESLNGDEFQNHPELLDKYSATAEAIAKNDESDDWIAWSPYGSTANDSLKDDAVHVWVGRARKEATVGAEAPIIKTRSILPMSPTQMVDLLLDSSLVKTYNAWSTGRHDVWVSSSGKAESQTKIVKNRTRVPIGSKDLVGVTLLHAAPVHETGAWIVVSRAVGGAAFLDESDLSAGRSDILLGINLMQPLAGSEDSCVLTTVTHMYSNAIPVWLAEQMGVKSATKFVKDMRKLQVPA
jgi:hypothetical protein